MSKNNEKRVFTESNVLLWICIVSSAIFLGLYAMIDLLVADYPKWLGLVIFAINALFAVVAYSVYKKKRDYEESFKAFLAAKGEKK